MKVGARPDRPLRARAGRSSRSAPTAWAARDTREALRRFFEIDTGHVVVAVLGRLCAEQGEVKPEVVKDAIARYDIDPNRADPYVLT